MSTPASNIVPPPSDNTTLEEAEDVNDSLAREWKSRKAPRSKKPIRIPQLPPLDPVGERIRRELQRRRHSQREPTFMPGLEVPIKMYEDVHRIQRRMDSQVGGTRRRWDEKRPEEVRSKWHMPQLFDWWKPTWDYNHNVPSTTLETKALNMAKESLYVTQERIRLLDDYVDKLQRESGSPALFNIGYTIKKMRGLLEDCYVLYTVLYRYTFAQINWKSNTRTSIHYYTYCYKKYIDIIYYVEAVMVAYGDVRKDNYGQR